MPENKKQIGGGAEALVYQTKQNTIDKTRIKKSYRIPEIDISLRKTRTKRESNILKKLEKLIPVPKIIKQEEYNIEMEQIEGIQLKKILDKDPKLAELIGKNLTIMHDNDIIHGDLTTSNMILKEESKNKTDNENQRFSVSLWDKNKNESKLYFIDFGLSFTSNKVEDKAVDIHLFKQALESKHYKVYETAYKHFIKTYNPKNNSEILKRLEQVGSRGRYK